MCFYNSIIKSNIKLIYYFTIFSYFKLNIIGSQTKADANKCVQDVFGGMRVAPSSHQQTSITSELKNNKLRTTMSVEISGTNSTRTTGNDVARTDSNSNAAYFTSRAASEGK